MPGHHGTTLKSKILTTPLVLDLEPIPINPQGVKVVERIYPVPKMSLEDLLCAKYFLSPLLVEHQTKHGQENTRPFQAKAASEDERRLGQGDPVPMEDWSNDDDWWKRFRELYEFREKYGSCSVPYDWKENIALANWVKRQRYHFTTKQAGKRSNLSDDRQTALERIGFRWQLQKSRW
jgi:hypothetical protein